MVDLPEDVKPSTNMFINGKGSYYYYFCLDYRQPIPIVSEYCIIYYVLIQCYDFKSINQINLENSLLIKKIHQLIY